MPSKVSHVVLFVFLEILFCFWGVATITYEYFKTEDIHLYKCERLKYVMFCLFYLNNDSTFEINAIDA
jgi:hypothetical protein